METDINTQLRKTKCEGQKKLQRQFQILHVFTKVRPPELNTTAISKKMREMIIMKVVLVYDSACTSTSVINIQRYSNIITSPTKFFPPQINGNNYKIVLSITTDLLKLRSLTKSECY